MGCSHATEGAMPIGSQRKAPRSRYFSSSSISNSADRSPTASSIINLPHPCAPTARSKSHTTKPTTPSKTSSNCSKLPEFVEVFLFTGQYHLNNAQGHL